MLLENKLAEIFSRINTPSARETLIRTGLGLADSDHC